MTELDPIEVMKSARYPFAFAIDIHLPAALGGFDRLAALGIEEGELTIRVGWFPDAPDSWHTFFGAITGCWNERSYSLQLDDAAMIERQVRMVLADPDLAQQSMDADPEETVHTHYWEQLSALGAMFDRISTAPHDHRLSYVILAEPGMPAHIERIIRANE